ncbi:Polyribonucleotide nucleotidyltransferase [Phycisphaerae bacterium RAS2]|nr:Polyribonucleotide nucleotidyltransferase [Phycisphaerae bacterium RAS2]
MTMHSVEAEIGGRIMKFETGKLAKLASGAVTVTYGDTVVLCTAVMDKPREGIDFFPLTIDYREKMYAAGKFPGGFFKREARPTQKEILTMRLTDRPLRPLFPDGFMNEVQIQCMVLSSDQENDADVLAMSGASAALMVSNIPFDGPVAGVRVGRVDGQWVINPTIAERAVSDIEVVLAVHRYGVNMIEVAANELPEKDVADAIAFGHEHAKKIVALIQELGQKVGRAKEWTPPEKDASLPEKVAKLCEQFDLKNARRSAKKEDRKAGVKDVYQKVIAALIPEDEAAAKKLLYTKNDVVNELQKIEERLFHMGVLDEGVRSDGRGVEDIRQITCEVGVLPRTHGSALFTRGETQALVVTTLGTSRDEQMVDDLIEEYSKKFMLHYNFPPFCTGEAKRIGAVSRREIGHGNLAERSIQAVLPTPDKFPYTIRLVSDIMESNGSSSMASVCGGTLALMDAGVPIRHPVAGISIGMVHDDNRYKLLVDIMGEEDHFGDMDFKVSGSQVGITAVQLDLKTREISQAQIVEVLELAKKARLKILKDMLKALPAPRADISNYAPRLLSIKVHQDKIGKIIGPGGKGIKALEANTGATIDIQDDGTVFISSVNADSARAAYEAIEQISEGVKLGKVYNGKVTSIKEFGAFIEVAPGLDGLCHISELSDGYVQKVTDVCKIGDEMRVKVILIDDTGRVKLSRKAVLMEEKSKGEPVASA